MNSLKPTRKNKAFSLKSAGLSNWHKIANTLYMFTFPNSRWGSLNRAFTKQAGKYYLLVRHQKLFAEVFVFKSSKTYSLFCLFPWRSFFITFSQMHNEISSCKNRNFFQIRTFNFFRFARCCFIGSRDRWEKLILSLDLLYHKSITLATVHV